MMIWNVVFLIIFFKIKYIYFFIVGGLFCIVEFCVFFEFDGNVMNYEDLRYCGGNIKYKIY